MEIRGGGGGGRTKSNSVCFTKDWVKIGTFNAALRAKFAKLCQWTKKITDAVVYRFFFQNRPKETNIY